LIFKEIANSSYEVVSGTDVANFTSSTSGDEWNEKTYFATVDQLVGEEVTAFSSESLMIKQYEPRCAQCHGLFKGHSCQQCFMSVKHSTFSNTPLKLPLLITKELERIERIVKE